MSTTKIKVHGAVKCELNGFGINIYCAIIGLRLESDTAMTTYFCKHFSRKSFASTDRCSGIGG